MKKENNTIMKTDGDRQPKEQKPIEGNGYVTERLLMTSQELESLYEIMNLRVFLN
jgi:hypothetical protein